MNPDLTDARWIRSRFCSASGCVEVAQLADGQIALRDSKRPGRPPYVFDSEEWLAFIAGAKHGEFDLPLT
jgi:Domain of unknown function (DUF397)